MATKKTKIEWPTAVVLAVMIASLAAVYVLVPEHRDEIMAGITAIGSLALAVMRPLLATLAPSTAPRVRRERETDAPPPGDA
jgi:uncharacterized membrane protein